MMDLAAGEGCAEEALERKRLKCFVCTNHASPKASKFLDLYLNEGFRAKVSNTNIVKF